MEHDDYIEERISFPVDGETCEGLLAYPRTGAARSCRLLLAPHPLLGGNMENNVVRHLARRMAESGAVTLRFNYRGVGGSTLALPVEKSRYAWFEELEAGQRYDLFVPEVLAAATFLQSAANLPLTLIGYSLGAVLTLMLQSDLAAEGMVLVCPPNRRVALAPVEAPGRTRVFVTAKQDVFFDAAAFAEFFDKNCDPKVWIKLEGCDHFLRGHEEELFQCISRVLKEE